ncbi:hypothetical protein GCM10010319_23300 [Streptomyces blastmyceticus]|uniref:Uncharacterized protein n=1 Tax=Streptomyces blastmyceticus TaxID=68180 RepID=A0ABP3GIU4_9ACTN
MFAAFRAPHVRRTVTTSHPRTEGGSPMDTSHEVEADVWERPDYTVVGAEPEVSGHSLTVR